MPKTTLLALFITVAACAQPGDEDSLALLDEHTPGPDCGPGACADRGDFDVDVFAEEVLPILGGEIDLNDPDGEPTTGCTRGPCHGNPRPGGFHLDLADTPESNVERFACFVDLDRPKRSQILVCPTNDERCTASPHPGPAIFTGPDDLNYRRILTYIRASRP